MIFFRELNEIVSEHLQKTWEVQEAIDMSEYGSHPCAILSNTEFRVFVKLNLDTDAVQQFEIEKFSLEYLAGKTGVKIPTPIGVFPWKEGALLVLEALRVEDRRKRDWKKIGKTLARIHRLKSDRFGFHVNHYCGPLQQNNTWAEDWVEFFAECRLRTLVRRAVASGDLPVCLAAQTETIIHRLPELCGPEVTPTLVHGDAQQNNFVSTAEDAFVIDPAIYFGHPEIDLACLDIYQPVPKEAMGAYREEMPVDPDFEERRNLWRIPGYLAGVAVEGSYYAGLLEDAIRSYL